MRRAERADARQIKEVPRQVRACRADDGLCVCLQQPVKIGIVDAALPVCGQEADRNAALHFAVQGAQDGVVLQIGREHVIAWRKQPGDRDIQRLGRIGREAHMIGTFAAEKRGKRLARGVDRPGCGKTFRVRAAAAVAHGLHRVYDRVDHARRLAQRRRRIVKIDHSVALPSDGTIIIQKPDGLQCGLPGFCSMISKTRRLQARIRLRGAAQTAVRRDEKRKHEAIERGGRPRPADSKQKVPEPVQYDRCEDRQRAQDRLPASVSLLFGLLAPAEEQPHRDGEEKMSRYGQNRPRYRRPEVGLHDV